MTQHFQKTVQIKAVDEDERTATGAVLVPNALDHQHDFLRPGAVERFHNGDVDTGVMHSAFPEDAATLERSEVIDAPETVGGEEFEAGTWIATRRYEDDDLWQLVDDGVLTGFSIGGTIERAAEHDTLPDDVRVPDAVEHDGAGGTELLDGVVEEVSDVDIPAVPDATYKGEDLGKSLLEDVDGETEFVELMVEQRGHDEADARRLYRYLTGVRGKASTLSKQFSADVFRLVAGEDSEMFDSGEVLGIGVDFPNHDVFVDWNVDAWPDDQRLGGAHVSVYDTVEDAQQVAQGDIEVVETVDAEAELSTDLSRRELLDVLKPFAGFEDFDDCVQTIMDERDVPKEDAREICGSLQEEEKTTNMNESTDKIDEPDDATKWRRFKSWLTGADDASGAEALGAAKATDEDDEDGEEMGDGAAGEDEDDKHATGGETPGSDDMTDDTEKGGEAPEWAQSLTEKVEQIEDRVDDIEGGEEKAMDEAPEWAQDLAEKVDDLDERVDTIATQSGHSQQLDAGAEKNGSDPDDEVEAFKAGLVGGRTGGDA